MAAKCVFGPVAEATNWQLISLWMGGCDFGLEVNPSGGADDCQEFNNTAMDDVLDLIPEAVSAVLPDAEPDSPAERVIPGYESAV